MLKYSYVHTSTAKLDSLKICGFRWKWKKINKYLVGWKGNIDILGLLQLEYGMGVCWIVIMHFREIKKEKFGR